MYYTIIGKNVAMNFMSSIPDVVVVRTFECVNIILRNVGLQL